jgi:hypothetical protein
MAERSVSTHVVTQFGDGLSGADAAELELHTSNDPTGENSLLGWQALRLFPNVTGVVVVASVGKVEYTGNTGQLERNEYVLASSSDSLSTQYPIDGGRIAVTVKFAYDADGREISGGQLSFVARPNSKTITANRPFTGAVQVVYTSSYRIYKYQPQGGVSRSGTGTAMYRNYGTVLAFKNPSGAVLEIEPPEHDEPPARDKELYRVTSVVQVNAAGAWEKHPTYDSGDKWDDEDAPDPDNEDALLETERVHEVGYVTVAGRGYVFATSKFFMEQGPPDSTFKPALTVRFSAGSEFYGTEWMDAYDALDLNAIENEIVSRFPGHDISGL